MVTVGILIAYMILGAILLPQFSSMNNFILYKGRLKGFISERDGGVLAFVRQNTTPYDATSVILMSMNIFAAIACCVSVTVLGGNERLVFFRETSTGQSVVAYFLSKVIETLAFMPIYAIAFILFAIVKDYWFIQTIGTYYIFTILLFLCMFSVGMLCSLYFDGNAGLFSLVLNITMLIIATSGAISDDNKSTQRFTKCFPAFWSSQGLITEEIKQYDYIFDVAALNAQTKHGSTSLGAGIQVPGAGMGRGWDLDKDVGENIGYCLLALFGWYFLVLLAMKLSSFKKHR